jgi:ubiquinone/menaquinone biosynthesis C-methylase UbiE
MNENFVEKICDPETHDPLILNGNELTNPHTGRQYSIQNGIPDFLNHQEVTGSDLRYQSMYDRFAPFYDFSTWAYSTWKGMGVESRLREYLDELEIEADDDILEVSVGTGRNLQFLPHTAHFYGLDISSGMIKKCQRNAAKWGLDVSLCLGTAEKLPFRDEAFDVVFHFGGINFFNDRAAAIREMIRVARPGTKFIIGDENEKLAERYQNVPVTGGFYGNRERVISAPVDLLPEGMEDIHVKDICGGDLYCLSFRKPGIPFSDKK